MTNEALTTHTPPKQSGRRFHYDLKSILTGSDLSTRKLASMECESGKAGPVVWLAAAIHGDEVGGIAVVHEIFKRLHTHPLRRGTIKAMPIMNPIGFEMSTRRIPLSEEDLNRSFPGDPRGRLSERIAAKIFQTIIASKPTLVIDLHNDWRKSIPYLLLDPLKGGRHVLTRKKTIELARTSDLIIVEERETDEDELLKTLSGSIMNAGIPAFTLELGESFVVNEVDVRNGVAAIWNILAALEMVFPDPAIKVKVAYPKELRKKILTYGDRPHSQTSGLVRFLAEPGSLIRPDQPLARIYNIFGNLHETIRAEHYGVLLGYTDSAMVFPGGQLFAVGVSNHHK